MHPFTEFGASLHTRLALRRSGALLHLPAVDTFNLIWTSNNKLVHGKKMSRCFHPKRSRTILSKGFVLAGGLPLVTLSALTVQGLPACREETYPISPRFTTFSFENITYQRLGADLQPVRPGAPPRRQRPRNPGALAPHTVATFTCLSKTFPLLSNISSFFGGGRDSQPTCVSKRV